VRVVRQGKDSGQCGTHLVASLLAGANRRYTSGSPFWFRQDGQSGTDRHRADTSPKAFGASIGTASSRFIGVPDAPVTDSPFCTRSSPFHFNFADYVSVPFVPTAANSRDSQENIGREESGGRVTTSGQQAIWSQCFARPRPALARELRTGRWVQARLPLRREASPAAEDKALARDTSSGQCISNNRGDVPAPEGFRGWNDPAGKTKSV